MAAASSAADPTPRDARLGRQEPQGDAPAASPRGKERWRQARLSSRPSCHRPRCSRASAHPQETQPRAPEAATGTKPRLPGAEREGEGCDPERERHWVTWEGTDLASMARVTSESGSVLGSVAAQPLALPQGGAWGTQRCCHLSPCLFLTAFPPAWTGGCPQQRLLVLWQQQPALWHCSEPVPPCLATEQGHHVTVSRAEGQRRLLCCFQEGNFSEPSAGRAARASVRHVSPRPPPCTLAFAHKVHREKNNKDEAGRNTNCSCLTSKDRATLRGENIQLPPSSVYILLIFAFHEQQSHRAGAQQGRKQRGLWGAR